MPAYLKGICTDMIRLTALQYNKAPIYSPAKAIYSKVPYSSNKPENGNSKNGLILAKCSSQSKRLLYTTTDVLVKQKRKKTIHLPPHSSETLSYLCFRPGKPGNSTPVFQIGVVTISLCSVS